MGKSVSASKAKRWHIAILSICGRLASSDGAGVTLLRLGFAAILAGIGGLKFANPQAYGYLAKLYSMGKRK